MKAAPNKRRTSDSLVARVPFSTKRRFVKIVEHENRQQHEEKTATDIFIDLIETEYVKVFGERR